MTLQNLELYMQHVKEAFINLSKEYINEKPVELIDLKELNKEKISVITGISGSSKGRIIIETSLKCAEIITEKMNGEPLDNIEDLYAYMAEFSNILCGMAITCINNKFSMQYRLTPPAVFKGEDLRIVTPKIKCMEILYLISGFTVKINAGFEGV